MKLFYNHKKQVATDAIQAQRLLSITCIFWLIAKIIGWKIWMAERSFPVVAPLTFLDKIPATFHLIFFLLSICLLLALIVIPGNKIFQTILFISELCSCLLDENRWQPWQYLYLFILLIFILNRNKQAVITNCFTVILATIYFYSGLHKFNEGFLINIWDTMILKRFFKIPTQFYHQGWIHLAGYSLAFIESVAGIGLLFSNSKKMAAIVLIGMHLFILLIIGPLGLHYNKIVWPWNAAMIFYLYFIFISNRKISQQNLYLLNVRNKIFLLYWCIFPSLNFIGVWDNYLSWNIYSSTLPVMAICIKDTATATLFQPYLNKKDNLNICDGNALLNIQNWAMRETNVPPYPEERVYKKIEEHWKRDFPLSDVSFVIYYFPFKQSLKK